MDYAQQQRNPARHLTGITVVVLLHILLGYALVTGLARRVIDVVKAPIETKIIEEVKPPPPPPPENLPPPPKTAPPPPSFVPPPEIEIKPPPTPPPPVITTTTVAPPPEPVHIEPAPPVAVAPPPAPPAPPPAPPKVAARPAEVVNIGQCSPTTEDYPRAARRAEATGTTKIRVTVDATGKLSSAEISKPSGLSREHRMLDRVALDKLSTCQFRAGIDTTGKPVGRTWEIEYVWKLTQ